MSPCTVAPCNPTRTTEQKLSRLPGNDTYPPPRAAYHPPAHHHPVHPLTIRPVRLQQVFPKLKTRFTNSPKSPQILTPLHPLILNSQKRSLVKNISSMPNKTNSSECERKETWDKYTYSVPNGLPASIVANCFLVKAYCTKGVFCYFIDRNPRFLDFILDLLRDPNSFQKNCIN